MSRDLYKTLLTDKLMRFMTLINKEETDVDVTKNKKTYCLHNRAVLKAIEGCHSLESRIVS